MTGTEPHAIERSDTAHHHWDKQWQTEEGKAAWLKPDPGVFAFARERFEKGDRLALDLGCGVGRHALTLAAIGFETSAMDGSPAGLEALSKAAAEPIMLLKDFELLSLEDRQHAKPGSWHWHITAERTS